MSTFRRDFFANGLQGEAVRLNKYLSDAGVCSRREADRLTLEGSVLVDGVVAVPGMKIFPGQKVEVNGAEVTPTDHLILLLFNKPAGVECTSDLTNPDNVISYLHYPERIYPVGRLDKNSTGLLLLTNAGEMMEQVLRGSHAHEKEYLVQVNHPVTEAFLNRMRNGMDIEIDNENRTVQTRPCQAEQTGTDTFSIILTQGFNRQIRRMCAACGYQVKALQRVRVMNLLLGDLQEGTYRDATDEEILELKKRLEHR